MRRLKYSVGALWGANDISKMARRGTLKGLKISMAKHPSSLKLEGALVEKLTAAVSVTDKAVVLYDGPVRQLCPMAPNNVNTVRCERRVFETVLKSIRRWLVQRLQASDSMKHMRH